MKALTFQDVGTVRCEQLPDPAIMDPTDALVEVDLAAICGSDLHVYHGRETGLDCGTVMGHEFVGRIAAVGRDVTDLRPGDRVASPFTTSCGSCFYCSRGLPARCPSGRLFGWVEKGEGLHGAQAELVRVPLASSTLFKIPDELASEAALLLGDVLATGWFAALQGGVSPGSTCAIVGCGPVGLMAALASAEMGAGVVFAIDSVPERLALAARFGATPVDGRGNDAASLVRDATGGRGADAVVEAVGSPEAGRLAFDLVRSGGTLSVVGVHHEAAFPFSPGQAYDRNLTYRIGRCPVRALMGELLPLALRRSGDIAALFTHRLPLARGSEGYETFAARRDGCIKVALVP